MGKVKDAVSAMPKPIPQMCLRLPINQPISLFWHKSKSTSSERRHAFFSKVGVFITLFRNTGNQASITLGFPNAQVSVEQDTPYRKTPSLREVTDPVCNLWELLILH